MLRALLPIFAAALLLTAAASAVDDADSDRVDLTAPTEEVDAQREQWRERVWTAREAVAEARLRHTLAQDAYGGMRHRRRERGDEKAQVMAELSASKMALAEAEAALEDLLETARKAGVPPGWLRTNRPASAAISTE